MVVPWIPDWLVIWALVLWVSPFFLKPLVERFFDRKAKLISYLLHASSVTLPPTGEGQQPTQVNLHTVVIRNAGKKPLLNVRLGHTVLPNYSIYPSIIHNVNELSNGAKELHFPVLVPNEQVTIQYLYFPPLYVQNVNTYTKSDEGFAKVINLLPTPQLAKPLRYAFSVVFWVGVIALLYLLLLLVSFLAHMHNQAVAMPPHP